MTEARVLNLSVSAIAAHARGMVEAGLDCPDGGWPLGAPAREFLRSPSSCRIGHLAAREGLRLFHYEHRAPLDVPDAWLPEGAAIQDSQANWEAGVLREPKYGSFRHDLSLGSFHPLHHPKWTTHELLHGLVGFAWNPNGGPLFHVLAARLAELLPVALWYFFDEAYLRRCPMHRDQGALFRERCARCEDVAVATLDSPRAHEWLEMGLRYVDAELQAVRRSRETGCPVPSRWATLNLSTDALAYYRGHAGRIASESHERFVCDFTLEGGGRWSDLDALEDRVVELLRGMLLGEPVRALAPSREAGRQRWIIQDVAARLCQVWEQTGGPVARVIEHQLDRLADGLVDTVGLDSVRAPAAFDALLDESVGVYRGLTDDWELPPAEEVFAVGYPVVSSLARVSDFFLDGLVGAAPLTARLLGQDLMGLAESFLASDAPSRLSIGTRWATWLGSHASQQAAELAAFEAALSQPLVGDMASAALGGEGGVGLRMVEGARLLEFSCPVLELAAAVEEGRPLPRAGDPAFMLIAPTVAGERLVIDLSPVAAACLKAAGPSGSVEGLSPEEAEALVQLGGLRPLSWDV